MPSNSGPTIASTATAKQPVKSSYADWAGGDDDDVNGFYASGGPKPQRGGKKRRKKNREEYAAPQSWDDYYDPTRPTNYEEYKHSDECTAEIREWKDRLYAHRKSRRRSNDRGSSEEPARPSMGSMCLSFNELPKILTTLDQFAPPSYNAFAPPLSLAPQPSFAPPASYAPPPPPPADMLDLKTCDDAFARRLALNQEMGIASGHTPGSDTLSPGTMSSYSAAPPPVQGPVGVISRAPVRYSFPAAPADIPASESELTQALVDEDDEMEVEEQGGQPRTNRPGQKGFAERLMNKYGWSKGSGLGADGSGIINPLHVQVQKRKKKPDSEGGGFTNPATGKIVGGKRNTPSKNDAGKFGAMSEVVILKGMVGEDDVDDEGGLIQEIGEECGEKYGNVERVKIWRNAGENATVFVKFTSQLSALRAVNALAGRMFAGNTISAAFYDTEKFEDGNYK